MQQVKLYINNSELSTEIINILLKNKIIGGYAPHDDGNYSVIIEHWYDLPKSLHFFIRTPSSVLADNEIKRLIKNNPVYLEFIKKQIKKRKKVNIEDDLTKELKKSTLV